MRQRQHDSSKARRPGPRRSWLATWSERLISAVLTAMISGGVIVMAAVLVQVGRGVTATQEQLAFWAFTASVLLTGITAVYAGITGFILLENRRMRIQGIMPHLQSLAIVRSGDALFIDLQNAGAFSAVGVSVRVWLMRSVGESQSRRPDAVLYCGSRPAIPSSQAAVRMQLARSTKHEATEFDLWQENLDQAAISPDAMDPVIALIEMRYQAVDGTPVSDCGGLQLGEQAVVPAGEAQ